jgi:NADH-quinone oxidoreductase subunit B
MGLSDSTLVAPAPKGILDPRTGKPVGSDDPYFAGLNNDSPTRASSSPRPRT